MKKISKSTLDKAIAVFSLSIVLTAVYIYCVNKGAEWISYAYLILGCSAACAYMIIMRGLYTHPDKTVFSKDLPDEERNSLAEEHRRHWNQAQPFLVVIIAVIISFIASFLINVVFIGIIGNYLSNL